VPGPFSYTIENLSKGLNESKPENKNEKNLIKTTKTKIRENGKQNMI
jgi:hypothetical protein